MRRLRPLARYWITKLLCPAAVTCSPKPGVLVSQKKFRSLPLSARALRTLAGVSLVRMADSFSRPGKRRVSTYVVYAPKREEANRNKKCQQDQQFCDTSATA